MKQSLSTIVFLFIVNHTFFAQMSFYDQNLRNNTETKSSLELISSMKLKDSLNVNDVVAIYFAEINVGKYLGGWKLENILEKMKASGFNDSIQIECAEYVKENANNFRYLDDNWKGEYNFWEPNYYWAEYLKKNFPKSSRVEEILFDLEFKELLRSFSFSIIEDCVSCEEYFKTDVLPHKELYLNEYSEEQFANYISDCKKMREKFESEKTALLKNYGYAPFTVKLQEVDSQCVILYQPGC